MLYLRRLKPRNKKQEAGIKKQGIIIFDFKNILIHTLNLILPIGIYKITGESMKPVLNNGESVLVNRFAYLLKNPNKGDIVAVRDPRDGKVLIKRIVKIEKGSYFIQGDNVHFSTDSRKFGMIEKKSILGKVF